MDGIDIRRIIIFGKLKYLPIEDSEKIWNHLLGLKTDIEVVSGDEIDLIEREKIGNGELILKDSSKVGIAIEEFPNIL